MEENKKQDRHLQAPVEANRDKHINFLAEERGEPDPADEKDASEPAENSSDSQNAVYTNGSAAQQEIERARKPGEDDDVFDNGLNVPLTDATASWNEKSDKSVG